MGKLFSAKSLYNSEISITQRLFVLCTFITSVVFVVSSLLLLIMTGPSEEVLIKFSVFVAVSLTGLLFVKLKKPDWGAPIILSYLIFGYFPTTFFNGNGATGGAAVLFVFIVVLISVMLHGKMRMAFYFFEDIIGIACYVIVYLYPQLLVVETSITLFIYNFIILMVICTSIVSIIIYQNRLYNEQNEIAEKQRKEIESLNAAQNRFFSSMSHEIRTPINTIIGLNEMIMREDISDEVAEDAVNIRVAGKMLLNLINDILDMSKFQAGDMHLLVESYSTGDMFSELVGMLWIRTKEKNLEFHINVAPDIPSELMGDEVRIKQILMNILNNAIKYTKEGSVTLSVECEKMEGDMYNIIYTVSDTGIGIKKEDIPYLFTAFKRVDESKIKHIEGTGLGLSIVKQFVDLMDGKITVNSIYTKGSSFVVEIPQKAVSDAKIGEVDYEKRHSKAGRMHYKQKFEAPEARILAVDDNTSNLLVVTKLLRDTKVQIDTAISGQEALKLTLNNHYDVIFMDHLMPEMDGIECFEKLRIQVGGKSKDSKVVVLTANAGADKRELYAQAGFNGYLIKPISGDDLESELMRLLPETKVHITSDGDEILKDTISWMHDSQKKRRIVITTDSVADLPDELYKKYGVGVIPHYVRTSEQTVFKDGVEIDTSGVLSYMETDGHVMLPEPPPVKDYDEFFARELEKANNVIHISISSKIANSGYPMAVESAKSFNNVSIIDSYQLSSGLGILVLTACYFADMGKSVEEIVEIIENIKGYVHSSFIVDNMFFLARAGQVSMKTASIMNSLMGRPVLVLKNGVMWTRKIFWGNKRKAWKSYINSCLSHNKANNNILFVTYVGLNKKDLDWIMDVINENAGFKAVHFIQASPAIAANCGPGTFGLLYMDKNVMNEKFE